MADIKESIALTFGTLLAGVFAFISWFYQSGLLGTVTGLAIGAGITYFTTTRTQNRVWKREYTVKITEQVYGEVFGELKGIIGALKRSTLGDIPLQGKWDKIQNDHRYFMVDKKFSEELDVFYSAISQYNGSLSELRAVANKILTANIKPVFDIIPTDDPYLIFSFFDGTRKIRNGVQPRIELENARTINDIEQAMWEYYKPSIKEHVLFYLQFNGNEVSIEDQPQIARYWGLCLDSIKSHEAFLTVISERQKLIQQANEIKADLEKRISKPWKF